MPQVFSSDSFESYQKLIEGMEYDEKMSELRALWTLQSQLETCSRALAGRLVAAGATSSMDGVGKGHVPGCPFQQPLSRPYGKRRPNKFHGCCGVDERGSFVMQDLTEGVDCSGRCKKWKKRRVASDNHLEWDIVAYEQTEWAPGSAHNR